MTVVSGPDEAHVIVSNCTRSPEYTGIAKYRKISKLGLQVSLCIALPISNGLSPDCFDSR